MRLGRMAAALTLAAAALTGAGAASAATVIAESHFDTGAEGWRKGDFTVGNMTYDVGWTAEDGFITAFDDHTHEQFIAFLAPASYLGDRRDARGGVLSFDLASQFPNTSGKTLPYVTLRGGGVLLFGLLRATPPGEAFSRFELVLTAENFSSTNPEDQTATPVSADAFDQVLRNLSQLAIRADIADGDDLASLDNVVMTTGAAVPEPAAWSIMIVGLGLTGAALRSERRAPRRRR